MKIVNETHDEERAFYNISDAQLIGCTFAGKADGESALKQCNRISLENCRFSLRYPLWHTKDFSLENCDMDEYTRAAVWYSENGRFFNCRLGGIKIFRECEGMTVEKCSVNSPEAGWRCKNFKFKDCVIYSEYFMFEVENLRIENSDIKGKYHLQYVKNAVVENCSFDTKDAFWHAQNVTVKNCKVNGEYLGWYSDGLTLIDCDISGTQPLCYCKNLKVVNCRMADCDRAFEYSETDATIVGEIYSVRNPLSGVIRADNIREIDRENSATPCRGEIYSGGKKV